MPSAQLVYYHCAQFHGECTLAPKFISTRIKEFSKMVRVFVPVLAAAFAFACVARAQTVDEVIAKNIQAHGGIEKLKSIKSARTTAKLDIDGPLVDYKEKGHKAELVGHDPVEGTDCYKVKLSMKNGDVRYYYLDTDSFLELKLEVQTTIRGALQETEIYYGDYEKVNGIYYPFSVEQAPKGSSTRAQISVEKVEQNVPLDDAHFSVPASKPEAKAPPAGS